MEKFSDFPETTNAIDRELSNGNRISTCVQSKKCPTPFRCSGYGKCRRQSAEELNDEEE